MARRKHRKILVDLLRQFKNPRAAEIGVSDGPTSEHLLKNVPNIHLLMVDLWTARTPDRIKKMKLMMDKARKKTDFAKTQRKLIKADSLVAAAAQKNESLHLVFVDACHRTPYVVADCVAWWPKLKSGGILCGHDTKREGIRSAYKHFVNLLNDVYSFGIAQPKYHVDLEVKEQETVWIIQKP